MSRRTERSPPPAPNTRIARRTAPRTGDLRPCEASAGGGLGAAERCVSHKIIGVRTSNDDAKNVLWRLVGDLGLRPLVDAVFPLTEVANAHRRIESGANLGRVVLEVV